MTARTVVTARPAVVILVALLIVSVLACESEGGGTGTPKLHDIPATPQGRLASSMLFALDDLPSGFAPTNTFDFFPQEDPTECAELSSVAEKFTAPAAHWTIDYEGRDGLTTIHLQHQVYVWDEPIAEARSQAGLSAAQDCWVARIRLNTERNAKDSPVDHLQTTGTVRQVVTESGATGNGIRIEAQLREAGLPYSQFFDILYVAHRRIMTVMVVGATVSPPSDLLEQALIDSAVSKAKALQP